jgi:hypothetical protein
MMIKNNISFCGAGSADTVKAPPSRRIHAAALTTLIACLSLGLGANPASAFKYVLMSHFGSSGNKAGELENPQGIAVDQATHDVYVADAGNHRIEKFDQSGAFVAAWGWGVSDGGAQSEVCTGSCQAGQAGGGVGQLYTPTAIAVDNSEGPSKGDVYVGDSENHRVEKFTSAGTYISSLSAGSSGEFGSVIGVADDTRGNVWVCDVNAEVYEFKENGSQIQQWSTGYGVNPGLAVDATGNVYAVRGFPVIEKFSSSGLDRGEFDPANITTTGVAFDPASDSIFSDQGGFVAKYDASTALPASPSTTFGQEVLHNGTGVGVDGASGAVYVAASASNQIFVFGPPPPGPPIIEEPSVKEVSSNSAQLGAKIYTGQFDTKYYFEYGVTESYGSTIPATAADIGSSVNEVKVQQTLTSLSPDTHYHYRVVAVNSKGTVPTADQSFTTFSAPETDTLPDGRNYELVSSPEKNGSDALSLNVFGDAIQVAASGNAVTYGAVGSYGGTQSAELTSQYLSARGAGGWSTQGISPPNDLPSQVTLNPPYQGFSSELSSAVLNWRFAPLAPQASIGYESLYVRNNDDGSYKLIATNHDKEIGGVFAYMGASADYSHIVFESAIPLTENTAGASENLYEWSEKGLSLVSIPPGGEAGIAGRGGDGGGNLQNAVSADGRLVFWSDTNRQLYIRKNGVETTKVNVSRRTPSLGDGSATFEGAAPNGEFVFFSDDTPLTPSPWDNGGLYELNTLTNELKNITPDETGDPHFLGMVGFGEDGSYVYFVAEGVLEDLKSTGGVPTNGRPNLYVTHNGEVSFIATLSNEDSSGWTQELTSKRAAVTPDGREVAFMSNMPLTGYDNRDSRTNKPDTEVFRYEVGTTRPLCVSCNPSEERPVGPSSVPSWSKQGYNSYYLFGDRLFFESADALVPRDTNGRHDVYEWERAGAGSCAQAGGCLYLLSSGTSEGDSIFGGAGASGDDVFIVTRSQLVPQDTDENVDIYDVRVDGGFPTASAPAPCADEACQGPLSAAPSVTTPATALSFASSGEDETPAVRHPAFALAAIGKRALETLARTGRLTLVVIASEAGPLHASITTRGGRRVEQIASKSATAREPGKIRLALTLTRLGRARLAAAGKLEVTIVVGYSQGATKRVNAVLNDPKAKR